MSVEIVDSDYFIVKSSGLYNPSGYNLLGSTEFAGGTVSNLALNDGSHMTFRSYPSTFSSTSNTSAIIAYRSNTGDNSLSSPKSRAWNGSAWSSPESEMATAGSSVRFVRIAYSSVAMRYYENIVVTLSDDGYLDAYVWNGSSWVISNDIASVGTTQNAYRPFDIEYEKTSGEALLAYFPNSAAEIGYKIWNGTGWSQEYTYDLVSSATVGVRWLSLAQNPTGSSNEIALVCIDESNSDVYALVWDGSSWGDKYLLTSSVTTANWEDIAVAYEQSSGYANFAYGTGDDAHVVRRTDVANYTDYTVDLTESRPPNWFSLKGDPASDRLMLLAVDSEAKLVTADWNSTTWTLHGVQDQSLDSNSTRSADIAWEPTGSKALMVWGTKNNELTYNVWTLGSGWGTDSTITMTGTHPWIQLRHDPRGVGPKILGATLDSNSCLGSLKWDGTTLTGTA
ncbi:MAG: hypothetical protein GTO14_05735, partial [Anaerolineales bacterium]|nr:hypothetical protein [Anaerolineales bacterium]